MIDTLQWAGAAILLLMVLVFLRWATDKLDALTEKLNAKTDSCCPKYEVRIYCKNGELVHKDILSYTKSCEIARTLKSDYYCEFKEYKD